MRPLELDVAVHPDGADAGHILPDAPNADSMWCLKHPAAEAARRVDVNTNRQAAVRLLSWTWRSGAA